MGKTKGSSSSRPLKDHQDEEKHQEEDLSITSKAKFSILSHKEGNRFTTLKFRKIIPCKYIPSSLLYDIGMHESFN